MLEGINHIDWEGFDEPDTPLYILGLISNLRAVRTRAYGWLESHVILWDYREEGYHPLDDVLKDDYQYIVVGFLIELLEHDNLHTKLLALSLLSGATTFVNDIDETSPEIGKERAHQIRERVRSATDIYIKLLDDNDAEVRLRTLYLLDVCKEDYEYIKPFVLKLAQADANEQVKSRAEWLHHKIVSGWWKWTPT